ncbi:MAG: chalcone isomerase family protein [Rubrivivax sp.]
MALRGEALELKFGDHGRSLGADSRRQVVKEGRGPRKRGARRQTNVRRWWWSRDARARLPGRATRSRVVCALRTSSQCSRACSRADGAANAAWPSAAGSEPTPDKGTQILVNGQPQGTPNPEPGFFAALRRIWLGPQPADALLKDRLLDHAGKPAGGAFDQGS